MQVCAALAGVHAQGLVHRDIKPSNILLSLDAGGRDAIKLVDFGLAKHVASPADAAISADADEPVVGTPLYISPEAITSPEAVDGRSDLYGLGAVAYFLLSGAPVFGGQTVIEVCTQHLLTPPEPLFNVVGWSMSADLEALVMACLAKDPAARPASAEELARRLARCADAEGLPALERRLPAGPEEVLQTSV
jgi:eukaryotic-like serine/threonine-protein kinase